LRNSFDIEYKVISEKTKASKEKKTQIKK